MGSIHTFSGGSGYPQSISGMFSIDMQYYINGSVVKAPIHSCCAGNSISFWLPEGSQDQTLKLFFKSPVNNKNHLFYLKSSRTPTG